MFMKYCPFSLFSIFFFIFIVHYRFGKYYRGCNRSMFLDWTPQNSEARPRIVRYNSYWGQWIQCNNSHDCVSTVSRHLVRYWQYLTVSLHDLSSTHWSCYPTVYLLIRRDVSKAELLFSWTSVPALVNGFTVLDLSCVKISQKFNYRYQGFFSPCIFFPFLSLALFAKCVDVFFVVVVYFLSHPNRFRIKVGLCLRVVLGRLGGGVGEGGK